MNLEDEFNNELKNKLDSRTFEYSEASWEKANALIQTAQKKKKRRFFFYLIFSGIILIGTILGLQYPFGSEDTNLANKETRKIMNNDQITTSTKIHEETLVSGNKADDPPLQIASKISVTETNDKKIKQEVRLISGPANVNVSIKKVRKSKSDQPKTDTSNEEGFGVQTKGGAEIKINAIPKTKDKAYKTEPTSDTILTNETLVIKENEKAVVETKSMSADSILKEKTIEVVKPVLTEKDSLPKSTPNSLATETKKDSTKNKINKLQVFAFVGASFTPGYVNSISIKETVNPNAGIFIRKTIKSNFGIGVGLFYSIYGNITETPKIFKNTTQDFGYKNQTTEIKQTRLHYLKLPVLLEYSKGKNSFSVGAQFMYLVTGSSNMTTYKESYGLRSDNSSKKVYGYTNGFKAYDISAIIGYRREITKKISVQIFVDFGFMDVKENTYFNSSTFDRNKSLQLNLGYKLFSK